MAGQEGCEAQDSEGMCVGCGSTTVRWQPLLEMPKAGLSSIESEGLSKQEENVETASAVWQYGTVAVFAMWLVAFLALLALCALLRMLG